MFAGQIVSSLNSMAKGERMAYTNILPALQARRWWATVGLRLVMDRM